MANIPAAQHCLPGPAEYPPSSPKVWVSFNAPVPEDWVDMHVFARSLRFVGVMNSPCWVGKIVRRLLTWKCVHQGVEDTHTSHAEATHKAHEYVFPSSPTVQKTPPTPNLFAVLNPKIVAKLSSFRQLPGAYAFFLVCIAIFIFGSLPGVPTLFLDLGGFRAPQEQASIEPRKIQACADGCDAASN